MKKALKWLGIFVLLLVVLPAVVVIAINAFDEKLDPAFATYGEPRATTIPEAENGYYALLALNAGDGADGAAYAKAWVAEARAAAKENRTEKQATPKRAKRPELCDASRASCLAVVREKPDEVKTQLDAHKEDLERYEKLIAATRFEEVLDYPMRMVSSIPSYGSAIGAQRVYLLRAAQAVEAGELEAALTAVERDLMFQRVFLEHSRTMIGRMVAASAYVRDLAFIEAVLKERKADLAPHLSRLRDMLKPLSAASLRLGPTLETEFGLNKHLLRDPLRQSGDGEASLVERIGVRLVYKPNATTNLAYRQIMAAKAASEGPPHTIKAAGEVQRKKDADMGWWDYVDNGMGNILVRVAAPDFSEYALRLHDLDGYHRLIGLWVEMLGAGIGADGAADFAAKAEARFYDPYTQKPMRWDAEKKRLYFEAQGSAMKQRKMGVERGRVFVAL